VVPPLDRTKLDKLFATGAPEGSGCRSDSIESKMIVQSDDVGLAPEASTTFQ
jgi:hypothetical protein